MEKPGSAEDPNVELFKSIGLSQAKAAEAAKSPKPAAVLKDIIDTNETVAKGVDEKQAGLIAGLAVLLVKTELAKQERDYAISKILNGDLKSADQVAGKLHFGSLSQNT